MTSPESPFVRALLDQHAAGTLSPAEALLMRAPWAGILVGVGMLIAGSAMLYTSFNEWSALPEEPTHVGAALTAEHADQWVRWEREPAGCAQSVPSESYTYLAVPQEQGPTVWIASDEPMECPGIVQGVARPAKRSVLERLERARPGEEHYVLWTHAGPSNSLGVAVIGAVFATLGWLVAWWFASVGRAVRRVLSAQS